MSHIPFQPSGSGRLDLEADYVVVGSGAGGATAAVTLARHGFRVAIVEAGPWRDPKDYPSSTYGAMRDMMDDWGATVTVGKALWPVVQARVVGGTTTINSAICVRTPGDIFDRWKNEFGVGGEEMAKRVWAAQDDIERELSVEEVPLVSLGRSNELALEADKSLGYQGHVMRRYVKGCEGSGQCLQGCKNLRKQSTNLNYVPETIEKGGWVVSSAPVKRVLFERERAVGVEGRFKDPMGQVRGRKFIVRARHGVFVAASATHTPILLQRSKIKNPLIGKFFRAHPGTGIFGVYKDAVDQNRGATQGWASTHFREDPGLKLETLAVPLEMVASRLSGAGTQLMARLQEYRHLAMWVHSIRAESHGTVKGGPFGNPIVRYSLDRADMVKFREGLKLVARMHFAAGAEKVIPGIYGLPYSILPDQIDKIDNAPLDPSNYVAILSHLFGGAVMGTHSSNSVINGSGRVHGYDNLYVACAAAIPSNLGVNPQHTIMALARTFAEDAIQA